MSTPYGNLFVSDPNKNCAHGNFRKKRLKWIKFQSSTKFYAILTFTELQTAFCCSLYMTDSFAEDAARNKVRKDCEPGWFRTIDPLIKSQMLYH
jgi:hypothetical protein